MASKVQCYTHGEQERTFVCRHIVDSLDNEVAVGFHWANDPASTRPDAWCSECERMRIAAGGEWTSDVMAFVQVQLLCGACYDRAKSIGGRSRDAADALKH